jgi:hypothetical protein
MGMAERHAEDGVFVVSTAFFKLPCLLLGLIRGRNRLDHLERSRQCKGTDKHLCNSCIHF